MIYALSEYIILDGIAITMTSRKNVNFKQILLL